MIWYLTIFYRKNNPFFFVRYFKYDKNLIDKKSVMCFKCFLKLHKKAL